jgi:hypothetical protein
MPASSGNIRVFTALQRAGKEWKPIRGFTAPCQLGKKHRTNYTQRSEIEGCVLSLVQNTDYLDLVVMLEEINHM